jgi:murein DD-endopeptidase MepM/ murein hydrolase activator NlpD
MPLRVFPVDPAGKPTFGDDYGAMRGARSHGGIDIFAPEGTPVLAVDDGRVRYDENKLGGHTAYLTATDGAVYYYAHLSRYEGEARPVQAGDVIAYVGHTGNAATTPPHCHFQERQGGSSVDPFPDLVAVAPRGSFPKLPAGPSGGSAFGWLLVLLLLSQHKTSR